MPKSQAITVAVPNEAQVETSKATDITPRGGKRVRPSSRAGTAGIAVLDGNIVDPETNAALKGTRKWKTYSEILSNVDIVGAAVRLLLNMVGKATWTVEPAEDGGARADAIAETVEAVIHDMERPWHRVVRRAAMYRVHGYSWQEWISKKRSDGAIGFFDIEPRSPATISRWDVDEGGTVFGVFQESPQTYQENYIPRAKSVYVVDDTISDSPEGLGIMRHIAPAATRLQAYERLEGLGFENDLQGVPVGRAPYLALAQLVQAGTITQAQADGITEELESFVTDHARGKSTGLVVDSAVYKSIDEAGTPSSSAQWGVDLLSASNSSQPAVAKAIERLTRSIARLLGAEHILLGESGGGSLAMARSKAKNFGLIVDGTLVEIAQQFDKDLIGPLAEMNGWPDDLRPTFKTEKLQSSDITEIADALESLSRAGAPLDPADEAIDVVREILGLPKRDVSSMALDASLRGDASTPGASPASDIADPSSDASPSSAAFDDGSQ